MFKKTQINDSFILYHFFEERLQLIYNSFLLFIRTKLKVFRKIVAHVSLTRKYCSVLVFFILISFELWKMLNECRRWDWHFTWTVWCHFNLLTSKGNISFVLFFKLEFGILGKKLLLKPNFNYFFFILQSENRGHHSASWHGRPTGAHSQVRKLAVWSILIKDICPRNVTLNMPSGHFCFDLIFVWFS